MKCPHCDGTFTSPKGEPTVVMSQLVLVITCPNCNAVLGVINRE